MRVSEGTEEEEGDEKVRTEKLVLAVKARDVKRMTACIADMEKFNQLSKLVRIFVSYFS